MRILHLRASNFYGGPERQLHFHALLARDRGYDISIASYLENGSIPEFLDVISKDGIKVHCFSVASAYELNAIRLVRKYLAQNNIDILCTHDYRSQAIGFLASRGSHARWVAFSRGATTENIKVRLFQAIESFLIRFADHIVAVSNSQKLKLRRLAIDDAKITVVHNSINISALRSVQPVDLRRKFGLPEKSIICVAAGRFSSEKGQIFLVRAAKLALKNNNLLRFLLFGEGPDLENVRAAVARLMNQECVLCPGFERNILGCIKGADILINPSISEGLPNVVLEGMALGKPVIATAVGGVPELICHGESGFLVPAGRPEKLADAILRLVADPELRIKLKNNGYETVNTSFSFENQMKRLESVYELVGKQRNSA